MPMEVSAHTLGCSTPALAKMVSWKYAHSSADACREDLASHHHLKLSKRSIQHIHHLVASEVIDKEDQWSYPVAFSAEQVATISISRDGTTAPLVGEGYREVMTGTISFYDHQGQRLGTLYSGAAPQHGREVFNHVFGQEIEQVQAQYPHASITAVADGDPANWTFLSQYTQHLTIDYWHATEYLAGFAHATMEEQQAKTWLSERKQVLQQQEGGAQKVLEEMRTQAGPLSQWTAEHPVRRAVVYFGNHQDKMGYAQNRKRKIPIGSGIVEAACKTLVKQRMDCSGCRWNYEGMEEVLVTRSMAMSNKWDDFWSKVDHYGF